MVGIVIASALMVSLVAFLCMGYILYFIGGYGFALLIIALAGMGIAYGVYIIFKLKSRAKKIALQLSRISGHGKKDKDNVI